MSSSKPISFRISRRPGKRNGPGQALLEFALALPILLTVIFGIVDFALVFQAWLSVENVARQTLRYAVTGQYDPAFCVDVDGDNTPCGGASKNAEEDAARLKSIQQVGTGWTIGLMRDTSVPQTTAGQSQAGYFDITVCSSRDLNGDTVPDLTIIKPVMGGNYANCLLPDGTPTQDAGTPGDRVYIMVDFNHPYITPLSGFFNQVAKLPNYVHLVSTRDGIVETFRVARAISVPPQANQPTDTATNTLPPTATFTRTLTFTPTITRTPTQTYTPTNTPTITNTPTKTLTPTITYTPTITPTPDCSLWENYALGSFSEGTSNGLPRLKISVTNPDPSGGAYLQSVDLNWDAYDAANSSQSYRRTYFNLINSGHRINNTQDTDSHTTFTVSHSSATWLPYNATYPLYFDFSKSDSTWSGIPAYSFGLTLTFSNGCTASIDPQAAPTRTQTSTPSTTPTPANTSTITPTPQCNISGAIFTTDLNGDPQNVNGYDCPYGCVSSPYLASNGLAPGQWSWRVETVGNPVVEVNSGSAYLNPGQQFGPPSGVIVPLGLNMYNIPPNYFPGEFKVSVWQSGNPNCGEKHDNFKILNAAPSPTPSNTPRPTLTRTNTPMWTPTHTPYATWTPTPTKTPTPSPTLCFDGC